jgi:predicted ABC-type exoprotein transport system permease subunit
MDGVTTAIVSFLFVCIVFPMIVKSKPQYYAAFGVILVVVLLQGLSAIIQRPAFQNFAICATCFLQVLAMVLLILSAGGLTVRELAGDITRAIEVMRRGETKKETIIPLSGQESFVRRAEKPAEGKIKISDEDSPVPLE